MNARLVSARVAPLLLRRGLLVARPYHAVAGHSGLRPQAHPSRWPRGVYSISNLPAVRAFSFVRILPRLAFKAARLPAIFGASMIGAFAYIQHQTQQAGTWVLDKVNAAGTTVTDAATSVFTGGQAILEQMGRGWEKTKEDVQMPEWLRTLDDEDDEQKEDQQQAAKDDQMMLLTKKMIEIRSMLNSVGQSAALTLPSIVVIGSQSSGKSSVLEAIVGHEFLPKGSNMVTRRPIELTLINTRDASAEYGVFPALGLGKMTDFGQIQRTLTDLNLAVAADEGVSDDPIQLSIYSPNVPDLSLIDLPGYIQVVGQDQPGELKQKISELCDKYIQPPNIILAISAADVDLANSAALKASRRVDPRGERTIGVITKMDLVDAERGAEVLSDRKYPLRLGYVGVVCKIPHAGLFTRGGNITKTIVKNENAFFSHHPLQFGPESGLLTGTPRLRKTLMRTLEQVMASSLAATREAIVLELEEAAYEFKVQYNDRPLSAESYLAESLDSFKHSFKEFSEHFGRPQVRQLLKDTLDQRVQDLLAKRYWNRPIDELGPAAHEADSLASLPTAPADSLVWQRKLDASSAELTKLGIGRLATTVVANELQAHVDRLIAASTFAAHPFAKKAIRDASSTILNERFYSTSDQVENCIKPYKFEIEVEDNEWSKGRENATSVLKGELRAVQTAEKRLEDVVGRKKLRDVVAFVDRVRKADVVLEGDGAGGAGGFSSALLQKGREAVFLRDRADLLRMRLSAIRSSQCASRKNKYYCPEVFLDVVADKLTSTAVLFLNVELLSEFYYNFPRELDIRLGKHLTQGEIERFAREDPKVRRHLDLINRKDMLEMVLDKIESLRQLEGRAKADSGAASGSAGRKDNQGRRWGLF
ncbi:hypothetical protein DV737_g3244, partial [Chaetothyriales sp. CBS 132003]